MAAEATASSISSAKAKARNRREWPRYPAEQAFSLAASIDGLLLPCTVADVSLGGAKLLFDDEIPVGQTILLIHPDGRSVTCERVWEDARELGVAFDYSEDSLGLISICIRNMIDLERSPAAQA